MQQDLNAIVWPGWQTTRLIGQGGFGSVYEIQRNLMGEVEKAALKVISIPQNPGVLAEMRQNGYDDAGIRASLQGHLKSILAEYSLMRKLNGCSNIVSCDDVRYVPHRGGMGWNIYIKHNNELLRCSLAYSDDLGYFVKVMRGKAPQDDAIIYTSDIPLSASEKYGLGWTEGDKNFWTLYNRRRWYFATNEVGDIVDSFVTTIHKDFRL